MVAYLRCWVGYFTGFSLKGRFVRRAPTRPSRKNMGRNRKMRRARKAALRIGDQDEVMIVR
jgi:hypothetical protein